MANNSSWLKLLEAQADAAAEAARKAANKAAVAWNMAGIMRDSKNKDYFFSTAEAADERSAAFAILANKAADTLRYAIEAVAADAV